MKALLSIFVMFTGSSITESEVHPSKALIVMVVMVLGILTERRLVHPLNMLVGLMERSPSSITTVSSFVQLRNVLEPFQRAIVPGITTDFSAVPSNRLAPRPRMSFGKLKVSSELQFVKV